MWIRPVTVTALVMGVLTLAVPAAAQAPPVGPPPGTTTTSAMTDGATTDGATTTSTTTARSANSTGPILGDLNDDELPDRVTLLQATGRCGIRLELGLAGGGYQPPTVHSYQPPAPWKSAYPCPGQGVIIDLAADRRSELLVADEPFNRLLILRDQQVTGTYPTPPGILYDLGTADFNGDQVPDLYLSTTPKGFVSLLNQRGGTLVAGPVRSCTRPHDFVLADLDGNGATDAVFSYLGTCAEPLQAGIAVVLDTGRRILLRSEQELELMPVATVSDTNGDGVLDVDTLIEDSGVAVRFLGTGDGTFRPSPPTVVANHDVAHARLDQRTVIKVRVNDFASPQATLTITSPPQYGQLVRDSRYEVVYVRTDAGDEPDSFVYRLTEPTGGSGLATVTVFPKA